MNNHRKSSSINLPPPLPVLQQSRIKKGIQLQVNFNNGSSLQKSRNFMQIQDPYHIGNKEKV